jgi:hypothetical protein
LRWEIRNQKSDLVVICKVQGELAANVIKSHLESEGIPALMKWEALGRVGGITVDGLGQVTILVPKEFAEDAKLVIKPEDSDEVEWAP